MKFSSLQEYFYKLQNVLFVLILLPLLGFVYLVASTPEKFLVLDADNTAVIMACLIGVALMDWLIVTVIFFKAMTPISKAVLLSEKLDRYYSLTLIRYAVMSTSCLILALGYYLTDHIIFILLFTVALILYFMAWPRTARVCRHLKLKGDEREMVFYKKDRF